MLHQRFAALDAAILHALAAKPHTVSSLLKDDHAAQAAQALVQESCENVRNPIYAINARSYIHSRISVLKRQGKVEQAMTDKCWRLARRS